MKPAKAKCRIGLRFYTILHACLVVVLILFTCFSSVEAQTDGVLAWGGNWYGQLGVGTDINSNVPVAVNISGVVAVAAGGYHTAVVKSDGTVWTWGNNWFGQLGNGTNTDSNVPVEVNISSVVAVAAGGHHTVVLKSDGTVWAWGFNNFGQLGNGTSFLYSNVPVQADISNVIVVAAAVNNTFAVKSDWTVWAWGRGTVGQLGNGTDIVESRSPVQANISDVVAVATGGNLTVALKSDGTVWAWGDGGAGAFGNGTNIESNIPVQANISGVIAIAAGWGHTVALKSDGTVWTWGWNSDGQLGNGTNIESNIPVQANISGVIAIAAGWGHTVALKSDGTVWTWGWNSDGQLGNGTNIESNIPVQATISGVTAITAAGTNTAALEVDGSVLTWGANPYGQLGNGTWTSSNLPVEVNIGDIIAVSAGENHTVVMNEIGTQEIPVISVSPTSVNYGSIPAGSTSSPKMITVKNTGTSFLAIRSVTITGTNASEFSQINNCTTVPAKGSCTVTVTFTPTLPFGKKSAVMSIASNDPERPTINVRLLGQAPPPKISASPMSVNFAPIPVGATSLPKIVTIKNTGISDLVIDSITINGTNVSEFGETNDCTTIQAKGSCTVSVAFIPVLPFGKKSAVMSIASNDLTKPTVNVKLSGQAPPPKISVSPTSVNFGSVEAGAVSAPKIVTIKNTGTSDLTVSEITITGANPAEFGQTNNCTEVAKGGSCAITVTFGPASSGSKNAELDISSNDPRKLMYIVKLTGKGIQTVTQKRDLFVLDTTSSSIMVIDASSNGDVTPLRKFGNLTGLVRPNGVVVDTVNDEIIVANGESGTITTYARNADGNAAPLRMLTGVGWVQSITVDTINDEIIVGVRNAIKVYPRTANGDVAPLRVIPGDSTELGNGPIQVAVDTVNNEIIAANASNIDIQILVYARTANGAVSPLRTIAGISATSIALDTINNELIVGTYDSVKVYARTASGDATPLRTIAGDLTAIDFAFSVAVDTVNNEILVAKNKAPQSITVHARTANGNVPPLRTIAGDSTGIDWFGFAVAVDTINNEIFSANIVNYSVTVYPRTAVGDITPSRKIGGYPYLNNPRDIAIDILDNEIFVTSGGAIYVYSMTADGDVLPLRTIQGQLTGLVAPGPIDIDTVHNEIFVSDSGKIYVFDRTADGNIAPLRTFEDSKYSLGPLAVDTINDEVFVFSSTSDNSLWTAVFPPPIPKGIITVYSRTANGIVTPLRTIIPSFESAIWPRDLALDTQHNEILTCNSGGGSGIITVYSRTAEGNAAPLRTIYGDLSLMVDMISVAVDSANNAFFVSGTAYPSASIAVFSRVANGNAFPLRTITLGEDTGRTSLVGMALAK